MLYAAGVADERTMQRDPHVGIGSVWWEGNPCKYVCAAVNLRLKVNAICSMHCKCDHSTRVTDALPRLDYDALRSRNNTKA
jgi:hypothetical protein